MPARLEWRQHRDWTQTCVRDKIMPTLTDCTSKNMPIPEAQLKTWANQGATVTSRKTYASITKALDRYKWPQGAQWERYLQGSYANYTNVWDDSDVDVVVQLNSTFFFNDSELGDDDRRRLRGTITPPTYTWEQFRSDTLRALRSYFDPKAVLERNKCFEVLQQSGRRPAHVVPCWQLRYYKSLTDYIVGIQFRTNAGVEIRNYPKQHIDNGAAKNKSTHEWYKPTIRMFKNGRTRLVDAREIPASFAPSYFLECLLYNVPDASFGESYQKTLYNILTYLNTAKLDDFYCQSRVQRLFGNSPWQLSPDSARQFISKLVGLWNNWK